VVVGIIVKYGQKDLASLGGTFADQKRIHDAVMKSKCVRDEGLCNDTEQSRTAYLSDAFSTVVPLTDDDCNDGDEIALFEICATLIEREGRMDSI
jgi:hypothetical protein